MKPRQTRSSRSKSRMTLAERLENRRVRAVERMKRQHLAQETQKNREAELRHAPAIQALAHKLQRDGVKVLSRAARSGCCGIEFCHYDPSNEAERSAVVSLCWSHLRPFCERNGLRLNVESWKSDDIDVPMSGVTASICVSPQGKSPRDHSHRRYNFDLKAER